MKRKRYTEPQIVFALQQDEARTPVLEEALRRVGCDRDTTAEAVRG